MPFKTRFDRAWMRSIDNPMVQPQPEPPQLPLFKWVATGDRKE